jgi:ribosomal protein L13E
VLVEISSESIQAWYDERPKERKERNDRLIAEGKAIPPPARDLRKPSVKKDDSAKKEDPPPRIEPGKNEDSANNDRE